MFFSEPVLLDAATLQTLSNETGAKTYNVRESVEQPSFQRDLH
jgi:hypothetical protein